MTDAACKPLADQLVDRRAQGLVDIKYYIHNVSSATPAKLCDEAESVFDAIDKGAIEPFTLSDRHQR